MIQIPGETGKTYSLRSWFGCGHVFSQRDQYDPRYWPSFQYCMKKIGLLSDTHGYIDERILKHLRSCDEIWHAGDFGNLEVVDRLSRIQRTGQKEYIPLQGVWGNIDGLEIRNLFPEKLLFNCESVKVMIQHIGGYPGRYAPGVRDSIREEKVKLFISGHSHILKIIFDDSLQCLHMNPGAAGRQGWHKKRTLIRFEIDRQDIRNAEVIELSPR